VLWSSRAAGAGKETFARGRNIKHSCTSLTSHRAVGIRGAHPIFIRERFGMTLTAKRAAPLGRRED